jgi:hypothetical protein
MLSRTTLLTLSFCLSLFAFLGTVYSSVDLFDGDVHHVIAWFEGGGSVAKNNLSIVLLEVILLGIVPIVANSLLLTVAHLKGNLAGITRPESCLVIIWAGFLTTFGYFHYKASFDTYPEAIFLAHEWNVFIDGYLSQTYSAHEVLGIAWILSSAFLIILMVLGLLKRNDRSIKQSTAEKSVRSYLLYFSIDRTL